MMMDQLAALWIGCLIFGTALGAAGYVLANVIWRMMVANQWSQRRERLKKQETETAGPFTPAGDSGEGR